MKELDVSSVNPKLERDRNTKEIEKEKGQREEVHSSEF